jgi:hypothetical protein
MQAIISPIISPQSTSKAVVPEKLKIARASIGCYLLGMLIDKKYYEAAVKLGKDILKIGGDEFSGTDIAIVALYIFILHAC